MTKVLFVCGPATERGVDEFGKAVVQALAPSTKLNLIQRELAEDTLPDRFCNLLHELQPQIVAYNYYPLTMPWLNDDLLATLGRTAADAKHIAFAHDGTPPFPQLHAIVWPDANARQTQREFALGHPSQNGPFRTHFEDMVASVLRPPEADLTSNRVLTLADRDALRPSVAELTRLCPEMMRRKFPQVVFQHAFIFEQVKRYASLSDHIIVLDGHEDPIGPALQQLGYRVTITDPQLDGKDAHAVWLEALQSGERYEIVVSCSVIEHVADDVQFVQQLYQLLKPGGVALLTTDFNAAWRQTTIADSRLYTPARLHSLTATLPAESLHPPTWSPSEPYYNFDGVRYSFCSLAFRKPVRLWAGENVTARLLSEAMSEHRRVARQLHNLRSRYRDLQHVGPLTLRVVGGVHRLATRYPRVTAPLRGLINLTRGIWRRVARKGTRAA